MASIGVQSGELGTDVGPVVGAERVSELDTLRGVAVFGILLMNIATFGLPHAYTDPTVYGGAEGVDLLAWIANALFFEGTMRGLFSMLFGAGVILLTSRAEARGGGLEVADIYYRRVIWLAVFGLVHSWVLLWHGEILFWYGLAGLLLFPMRNLTPRILIIVGVFAMSWLFFQSLTSLNEAIEAQAEASEIQLIAAEGQELTEEQQEAADNWESIVEEVKSTPQLIGDDITGMQGNYVSVWRTVAPWIIAMQSTIFYKGAFFDVFSFMVLGMALLKLGVLTGERSIRFYLVTLVVGYGIGLTVNAYEASSLIANNFDVISQRRWGFVAPLYDVGRVPMSLGHVALVMLICKLGWVRRLTMGLAAVGRMALTNYVMHSVICAFIFYGFGFGLFGQLARSELLYVVFGIWIFQLIVSPIWLRHYRFGPLEWLWRSLTYWKRQPLRREPSPPDSLIRAA